MDQSINTSFIPKRNIAPEIHQPKHHPVSGLVFLSTVLFFIALIALGVIYFWKVSLQKNISSLQSQIAANSAQVDPSQVAQIEKLNTQLTAANQIVSNHQLIVPIFQALQNLTLKSIRYTRFSVTNNPETNQIAVAMSGLSSGGYTPIALQATAFSQNPNLHNPFFTNFSLDNKGNVDFDLTMNVDPSLVSYTSAVAAQVANNQPVAAPVAPTETPLPATTPTTQ